MERTRASSSHWPPTRLWQRSSGSLRPGCSTWIEAPEPLAGPRNSPTAWWTTQSVESDVSEFATIPEALEDLKAGRMIIVVDDPDRENEGDLVCAGETCSPEIMNFMIMHGRGVPFIPTSAERLAELQIP